MADTDLQQRVKELCSSLPQQPAYSTPPEVHSQAVPVSNPPIGLDPLEQINLRLQGLENQLHGIAERQMMILQRREMDLQRQAAGVKAIAETIESGNKEVGLVHQLLTTGMMPKADKLETKVERSSLVSAGGAIAVIVITLATFFLFVDNLSNSRGGVRNGFERQTELLQDSFGSSGDRSFGNHLGDI